MRKRTNVFGFLCLATSLFSGQTGAWAVVTTPTQTQTIAQTQTDWGPQTSSLLGSNPLVFSKFDPTLGTLQSVNVTLAYSVKDVVTLQFITPSLTTLTVKTSQPQAPNVGTVLTLNTTGDASNLLTASLPVLTYSRTDGGAGVSLFSPKIFSNDPTIALPGAPNYLAPVGQPPNTPNTVTGSTATTLTDANSLAFFTGPGSIALPAHASAHSSFVSSTGNGGASILTYAGITASISYSYVPVPEPSSLALLGLGGGGLLLACRRRRLVAC